MYICLFRNEKELRWAWVAWRNRMSHTKKLFGQLVKLQNIAARNNGNIIYIKSFIKIFKKIKLLFLIALTIIKFYTRLC